MSAQSDYRSKAVVSEISETSGQEPGLLDGVGLVGRELLGVIHDHLFLAALETRQAGESLVSIVAMGVIMAGLLLTAWLALAGALIIVLVRHSILTTSSALILVFAVHCLVAVFLISAIRKRSRSLMFPATLSQFDSAKIVDSDSE